MAGYTVVRPVCPPGGALQGHRGRGRGTWARAQALCLYCATPARGARESPLACSALWSRWKVLGGEGQLLFLENNRRICVYILSELSP